MTKRGRREPLIENFVRKVKSKKKNSKVLKLLNLEKILSPRIQKEKKENHYILFKEKEKYKGLEKVKL